MTDTYSDDVRRAIEEAPQAELRELQDQIGDAINQILVRLDVPGSRYFGEFPYPSRVDNRPQLNEVISMNNRATRDRVTRAFVGVLRRVEIAGIDITASDRPLQTGYKYSLEITAKGRNVDTTLQAYRLMAHAAKTVYAEVIGHPYLKSAPATLLPDEERFRPRGIGGGSGGPCLVRHEGGESWRVRNDLASFVDGKMAGERVVAMLGTYGLDAHLDFRPSEPRYVQVKIGACEGHVAALQTLCDMTHSAGGRISPAIIAAALNAHGVTPERRSVQLSS
jgi:hypothetical protein